MSFLKRLFSAPDEVAKVTDAVIAAGDKLVLTDEERLDANAATREWLLRFWEASKGGEIARRAIAMATVGAFLLAFLTAAGLAVAGSGRVEGLVSVVATFYLPELVGAVFVAYFGKGMVRDVTTRAKK